MQNRHPNRILSMLKSGPEKGVITKGVFSLEESLESPKSLDSLEVVRFSFVFHSLGVEVARTFNC